MTKINSLTMTAEEVSAELQLAVKTLYNKKSANEDIPPARKFGKKLIFLRKDVEQWLEDLPIAA